MSLTEEERRLQQAGDLLSELGIGDVFLPSTSTSTQHNTSKTSEPQYDNENENHEKDESGNENENESEGEYEGEQYYEDQEEEEEEENEEEYQQQQQEQSQEENEEEEEEAPVQQYVAVTPLQQRWEPFRELMENGKELIKDDKLISFVRQNPVPSELRGDFWFNVTGGLSRLLARGNVYEDLRAAALASVSTSPFATQIERDVARITVGGEQMRNPAAAEHLRALLLTYSANNTDVGYCQAMHLIAAHFLLTMGFDEELAYWTMDAVIRDVLPENFYSECMSGIKVEISTFSAISRYCYPKVLQHLDCLGVSVDMFLTQWFLSLFINILPEASSLRVLDLLFIEGFDVMYRVVLGLLQLHEAELLASADTGAAMVIVNGLPASATNPDTLIAAMYATKMIDKAEIQACREVFTKQISKGIKKSVLITLEEAREMCKQQKQQQQQQQQQLPPISPSTQAPQQKQAQGQSLPPPIPKAPHPKAARRKTQFPKVPPPPPPSSGPRPGQGHQHPPATPVHPHPHPQHKDVSAAMTVAAAKSAVTTKKGEPEKMSARLPPRLTPVPDEENESEEVVAKPVAQSKPVKRTPEEHRTPARLPPKLVPVSNEEAEEENEKVEVVPAEKPHLPQRPQLPNRKAVPVLPPKSQKQLPQAHVAKPLPKAQGKALPKPLPSTTSKALPRLPPKPLPKSQHPQPQQKALPPRPAAKALPSVPQRKPLPQVVPDEEEEDVFSEDCPDDNNNNYGNDDDDEDNPFFQ